MGCVSHVQCMLTILTYILLNCVLIHHMVMHVFCTLISKAINWWHSVLYFTIPSSISASYNAQIARLKFKGRHIQSHNKRHPTWKAHIPGSSQWFWTSIITEPDSISFKKESLVPLNRHCRTVTESYSESHDSGRIFTTTFVLELYMIDRILQLTVAWCYSALPVPKLILTFCLKPNGKWRTSVI